MNSMWKRSFALLLSLVMVFGMVPVNAFAEDSAAVVCDGTAECQAVADHAADCQKAIAEALAAEEAAKAENEPPVCNKELDCPVAEGHAEDCLKAIAEAEAAAKAAEEAAAASAQKVAEVQAMIDALPTEVKRTELAEYQSAVDAITAVMVTMTEEETCKLTGLEKLYPTEIIENVVAKIGDGEFESLQTAVDAAGDAATITLVADVEQTVLPTADSTSNPNNCLVSIPAGKNITLDLNSHTIAANGDASAQYDVLAIRNSGNLTIMDSSEQKTGKIILYFDGTNESGKSQIHSTILNFGTLNITGGTIQNAATSGYSRYPIYNYSWGGNVNLTVSGGEIIGYSDGNGVAVYTSAYDDFSKNTCNITISGGTLNGGMWYSNTGATAETNVVISDGAFVEGANPALTIKGSMPNSVAISGGTFTGAVSIIEGLAPITGGTFTTDVSAYAAFGYEYADGKVVESTNIKVTTAEELVQALAIAEGKTITLMEDITVSNTIKVEKPVTLDLNDNTVTGSAQKVFEIYADATIKNGKIINTNNEGRCVDTRTAVKLTLEKVELTAAGNGNTQPLTIGGYDDGVELHVKDCSIDAGKTGYSIISFVKTNATIENTGLYGYGNIHLKAGSDSSVFTVTGNSVLTASKFSPTETFGAIIFDGTEGCTVTMDANTRIDAMNNAILFSAYSGSVAGKNTVYLNGAVDAEDIIMNFVLGDSTVTVPASNTTLISQLEEEGYYVSPSGMVSTLITTVEELNAAIAKGGEYKLGANITLTAPLAIEKSVTLDGAGYKLIPATADVYDCAIMAGNSSWDDDHGETIILKNLDISGWKTNYGAVRAQGVTLNADGCTMSGNSVSNEAYGVLSLNRTDATVTGCTFENNTRRPIDINFNCPTSNAVVTIDGCTFKDNTVTDTAIVFHNAGNKMILKNSTFTGNTVNTSSNTAVVYARHSTADEITGNTFTGNNVISAAADEPRVASAVVIEGGTVKNNIFSQNTASRGGEAVTVAVVATMRDADTDISANYWGSSSAPVESKDYLVQDGSNVFTISSYYADSAKTTLKDIPAIAKIGNINYPALRFAMKAVKDGDTLVLMENVADNITVTKEMTLNLNGKTLTGNVTVDATGNLTITDSGENGTVTGTVTNSGKLTITGGTFKTDVSAWVAVGLEQDETTGRIGEIKPESTPPRAESEVVTTNKNDTENAIITDITTNNNVIKNVETNIDAEANETAVKNATDDLITNAEKVVENAKTAAGEDATVTATLTDVSTTVDIVITDVKATTEDDKTEVTITYDVDPVVIGTLIVTTTKDNTSPATVTNNIKQPLDSDDIKAPITFRLPVPSGVGTIKKGTTVYIKHTHGNNVTFYIEQVQEENGKLFIEMSSAEFSEFEVEFVDDNAPKNFQVGSQSFEKFEQAYAYTKTSGDAAIKVLQNTDCNQLTAYITTAITLDLNGKIVENIYLVPKDGGALTIKDSGTGGTLHGCVYVQERGTFNLESGNLKTGIASSAETIVGIDGGTANIKGGTVTHSGEASIGIQINSGILSVTGGTISGTDGIVVNGGNVNLSGGTVSGTKTAMIVYNNATELPVVAIQNGTFRSDAGIPVNVNAGISGIAVGGTYIGKTLDKNVPDAKYEYVLKQDNTYVIQEKSYIMVNGEQQHYAAGTESIKFDSPASVGSDKHNTIITLIDGGEVTLGANGSKTFAPKYLDNKGWAHATATFPDANGKLHTIHYFLDKGATLTVAANGTITTSGKVIVGDNGKGNPAYNYTITQNNIHGNVHVRNSSPDMVISCNGFLGACKRVYITGGKYGAAIMDVYNNGSAQNGFSVVDGSTKVTLTNGYLNGLTDGTYTMVFQYKDGEQKEASFKVTTLYTAQADTTNPKTGDVVFAPMFVLFFSTAALAVLLMGKKKFF